MSDRRSPSRWLLAWLLLGFSGTGWSQATPQNLVFTCVTAAGRTLTSDRMIGECMDREQRVLARFER